MALGVRDCLFGVPAVAQRRDEVPHGPLLVWQVLDDLDPPVRHPHCESVVEPHAALGDRAAQCGHPGDVLRDGDALLGARVDQLVGQHQVHHSVHIGGEAKVLRVRPRECGVDAVMVVQHGGHPVKPEPVELVLLEPPLDVGE